MFKKIYKNFKIYYNFSIIYYIMHNTTFNGLNEWYKHVFEKFGWLILCLNETNDHAQDKFKHYVKKILNLREKIGTKIKEVQDNDKRNDLIIMQEHLDILYNYIKNNIKVVQVGGKKYFTTR